MKKRKGGGRTGLKKALKRLRNGNLQKRDIACLREGDRTLEDIYGKEARAELQLVKKFFSKGDRVRLRPNHLQNLLLWILSDTAGSNPKWIFVKNKPLIGTILVVSIDQGLGEESKEKRNAAFKAFSSGRRLIACEMRSNKNNQCVEYLSHALLLSPSSSSKEKNKGLKKPKKACLKKRQKLAGVSSSQVGTSFPINEMSAWVHDLDILRENEYPIPEKLAPGFVSTNHRTNVDADTSIDSIIAAAVACPPASNHKVTGTTPGIQLLVAVDCEMCRTNRGLELTRVTVLDSNGSKLLDELVMPPVPITDYLTQYSGISQKLLAGVTTTLEEVRGRILRFVNSETVMVGHSLECDLKALHLCHTRVLDSAILFPHGKGYPYKHKLRHLAKKFLKRVIQSSTSKEGHDSAEDALAALDLVKLKLMRGHCFGVPPAMHMHNIFKDCVVGAHCIMVSSNRTELKQLAVTNVHSQLCTTDATALEYTEKILRESRQRRKTTFAYTSLQKSPVSTEKLLQTLGNSLPLNGVLILLVRGCNTHKSALLFKKRGLLKGSGEWTPECEEQFREAVKETQDANVYLTFQSQIPTMD